MKKTTLRSFNKDALKTTALLIAAAGAIGYQANLHYQNKTEEERINDFKTDLVQYEENIINTEPEKVINNDNYERIDISDKMPRIAVIYHDNGNVSLMINREYLSLESALEKYPTLTAGIKKYIETTYKETTNTTETLAQ